MPFPPTRTDPALITTGDGMHFVVWLEPIRDQSRWIFMSTTQMHYVGPRYAGEDSMEKLRDLVREWWANQKR